MNDQPQTLTADNPGAILAAVTFAVVGISFFMAMPVIVGAWSQYSGFSEQQAGYLAAIENGGTVLSSLFVSILLNRADRRTLAIGGIFCAVAANLASTAVAEFYAIGFCRLLSGFGGGTLYALGLAALAGTSNTGRNFSILLFVQVSFGMLEINLFSALAERAGINSIYLSMAFALTACLGLVPRLPSGAEDPKKPLSTKVFTSFKLPWVCLFAVFIFYIGVGAFWAYIERIGISAALEPDLVIGSLTYTQVLSLLGCVIAGWMSARLGQFRPLIFSLMCIAVAAFSLTLEINNFSFVSALCLFFLCWNAIDIYQLGTLGNLDHSGKFVALVPAFQAPATALGPAVAASLSGSSGSYHLVLLLVGTTACVAAVLYSFTYLRLRRCGLLEPT